MGTCDINKADFSDGSSRAAKKASASDGDGTLPRPHIGMSDPLPKNVASHFLKARDRNRGEKVQRDFREREREREREFKRTSRERTGSASILTLDKAITVELEMAFQKSESFQLAQVRKDIHKAPPLLKGNLEALAEEPAMLLIACEQATQ